MGDSFGESGVAQFSQQHAARNMVELGVQHETKRVRLGCSIKVVFSSIFSVDSSFFFLLILLLVDSLNNSFLFLSVSVASASACFYHRRRSRVECCWLRVVVEWFG